MSQKSKEERNSSLLKLQITAAVVLVAFFAGIFFLVGGEPIRRDDVLIFGRTGDASTLDPAHATDGETFYSTTQIYDTLVQFKYGTTQVIPSLAKKWEVSDDGLKYTFYLRQGVTFHSTPYFDKKVEFTADDVLFSLNRQKDKDHPYHTIGGAYSYWQGMSMSDIIKEIVKVDKYTVRFVLNRREAPFVANLAMNFASILCKDYADYLLEEGRPEDLARKPIGTGPFVFVKWIKDDRIIYKANPHYWDGSPQFTWLILKVINNASVRGAALKTGEIHVMDFPNPEELKDLEAHPEIELIKQEGLNVGYLAMNTQKKPFDNLLVRKAIYHAINKKGIIDAIYSGMGKPAKNPLPPTIWSYHQGIKDYEYDPEKARKLLEKAGYPDGFETSIFAMPVQRPYMPNARKVAEAVQANLKEVGISVEIVSYDWSTYLDKVGKGEHEMALLGWTGDNGDPDNFLYVLLSSAGAKTPGANNIAFYKNEKFDKILKKAKESSNRKERIRLYKKAQEIFHRDVPWVPLAHSIVIEPVRKRVKGFQLDPVGSRRFHKVKLAPLKK